jgi:hypothetical protein
LHVLPYACFKRGRAAVSNGSRHCVCFSLVHSAELLADGNSSKGTGTAQARDVLAAGRAQ